MMARERKSKVSQESLEGLRGLEFQGLKLNPLKVPGRTSLLDWLGWLSSGTFISNIPVP